MATKPTLYFDGNCPLCSREIAHYQRCEGAQNIQWFDVSKSDPNTMVPQLSRSQTFNRLHMLTADGRLVSGAEAFATLWLQLDRYKGLGRLVRTKPVLMFAEFAYRGFLYLRLWMQRLTPPRVSDGHGNRHQD